MTVSRLVFLEIPADLAVYAPGLRQPGDLVVTFAVGPRAQLMRQGVAVCGTTPFFTPDSHELCLETTHRWHQWHQAHFHYADPAGMTETYTELFTYNLRLFGNYLLWVAEVVHNALAAHPEARLATVVREADPAPRHRVGDQEGHAGSLLAALAAAQGRRLEGLAAPPAPAEPPEHSESFAPSSPLARPWRRLIAWAYARDLGRLAGRRPVVSAGMVNRMDQIAQQALAGLPRHRWIALGDFRPPTSLSQAVGDWRRARRGDWPEPRRPFTAVAHLGLLDRGQGADQPGLTRAVERWAADLASETALFSHRGLELGPRLMAKARVGCLPRLLHHQRMIQVLPRLLKSLDAGLVASPLSREFGHAPAEAARRVGVPSLMISHGSFTPLKNRHDRLAMEYMSRGLFHSAYAHSLLQSPLAREHAKDLDTFTRFVPSQPLAWGCQVDWDAAQRLRRQWFGDDPTVRVVMHASSPKERRGMHFYCFETMDEYLCSVQEVARAVAQLPNTRLVLRFRAIGDLTVDTLRTLLDLPDDVVLSWQESFLEVLGVADLLVSFSSTTLEEALQNGVPALVYGCGSRYRHLEGTRLPAPAGQPPAAVYSVADGRLLAPALDQALGLGGGRRLDPALLADYRWRPDQIEPLPRILARLLEQRPSADRTGEDS